MYVLLKVDGTRQTCPKVLKTISTTKPAKAVATSLGKEIVGMLPDRGWVLSGGDEFNEFQLHISPETTYL